MSEKPMDILNAVRALAQGKQPAADISDILYEHGCFYLLSMLKAENRYTMSAGRSFRPSTTRGSPMLLSKAPSFPRPFTATAACGRQAISTC